MGKSSLFPRITQDNYPTPAEAVPPLLPHLAPRTRFIEPCAGGGCLIKHIQNTVHVSVIAYDILDEARTKRHLLHDADVFLTNPLWRRDVLLHQIIVNMLPTWLLLDAAWAHTKQSAPYLPRLRTIVSVGRMKWIKDSPFTGKDDCAWHLFDRPQPDGIAIAHFIGRAGARRAA